MTPYTPIFSMRKLRLLEFKTLTCHPPGCSQTLGSESHAVSAAKGYQQVGGRQRPETSHHQAGTSDRALCCQDYTAGMGRGMPTLIWAWNPS